MKLRRIKWNYQKYYDKIIKSLKEGKKDKAIDRKLWEMIQNSRVLITSYSKEIEKEFKGDVK